MLKCPLPGISPICSTTDNAGNITNAAAEAGFPNFGCFAHTLNLAVKRALRIVSDYDPDEDGEFEGETSETDSDYKKLHVKFTKLVTRTRKSSNAKREFRECQTMVKLKTKRLKKSMPTRWNTE